MLVTLGISSSTTDKCWLAMESGKDEPVAPAITGTGQNEEPSYKFSGLVMLRIYLIGILSLIITSD